MFLHKINDIYTLMNGDKMIASSDSDFQTDYEIMKLSKENCDDIFEVVDVNSEVETIVKTICPDDRGKDVIYGTGMAVGIQCFNKAMELQKDKLFTIEDMIDVLKTYIDDPFDVYDYVENKIQSLRQPTEIEVEVEMVCPHPSDTYKCGLEFGCDEDGCNNPNQIPYLDKNGCLILTKKK
jgi:hypothetical protein